MAFELLIWIYITAICFAWGVFVVKIFNPGFADFPGIVISHNLSYGTFCYRDNCLVLFNICTYKH